MGCKYSCIVVFVVLNILFGAVCVVFWGGEGVGNFEVGFLSFFLVLSSAYWNLKRKIQKETTPLQDPLTTQDTPQTQATENIEATENTENTQEAQEPPKSKGFSHFILGLELFMGGFRLLAYGILILGLLALIHQNIFIALAYMLGIAAALLSITLSQYLSHKRELSTTKGDQ
ncbi:hypothetical protein BKH46_07535 [Helicobacter sp. 12S02634-8]|uniref:hypothetical protein n=1 Tax=Helicobacter sp. 12S02634-8 TaxID=1476199 RepID=UPI000BA699E1|nr:hypothetical protein [Helicobacter sp. 12S02634-8]PAF46432.1 hypothetical protein BKH46_07535 [Helicobacter sp. 12S02634-8]